MHSLTEENYLKAIYGLTQKKQGKISLTAIAEAMGINAASVIDMMKKLSEKQLISYDKANGAALTSKGQAIAVHIIRNHRLWEVFLLEKLGYSWDVVHEIAEQLEHIKHHELADRLDKFLGYPEYDPHGDPIPKSNGEIPIVPNTLLSEIAVGEVCHVAAIKDTSTLFLQYLQQLSIKIGTKIKVIEKIMYDGSLRIKIGKDQEATVSQKLAESLLVN